MAVVVAAGSDVEDLRHRFAITDRHHVGDDRLRAALAVVRAADRLRVVPLHQLVLLAVIALALAVRKTLAVPIAVRADRRHDDARRRVGRPVADDELPPRDLLHHVQPAVRIKQHLAAY